MDCHRQIHAMYSNKKLEEFSTVDSLLADEAFARFVIWVSRRPFGATIKACRSRRSRRRGRSG